ncbi:MAG: glycosyltransferase family 4 protein [Phycisphaerales bacterium]|nr:glycosyltransferase family 4 protein [Phycisphaerales bacterium]
MPNAPRKLLSIAHSYVVALNRQLPAELVRAGDGRWQITVVAPRRFVNSNDGRLIDFQPTAGANFALEVIDVTLPGSTHLFTYRRRLKELCRERWDLIHAWEEPYVAAGWQIARIAPPGTPMVFWTAQNLSKRYPPPFGYFERATVARASGWLACGQSIAQTLLHRPGYADRPHEVAPLGVDPDRFAPNPRQGREILRQLDWSEAGPGVIGYLGRFVPEKGLRILTAAVDGLRCDWRMLLVGAGPMEPELQAWASRHGGRVRICSHVPHDQVPMFLNAMQILVAPSLTTRHWREQFGRMLVEAMSCQVPVIGSDSGEIPYVIGSAGVIIPEGDPAALTAVLARLLESPRERSELAAAGRQRVLEQFSWPVIARRTLAFFDRIVDDHSSRSR